MSDVKEFIRSIRIRLFPNYLKKDDDSKGKFLARTVSETTLNDADICAFLKNRTDFEGNYAQFCANLSLYQKEAAYQIKGGLPVCFGGNFTVYPKIHGTFESEKDAQENAKHRIRAGYRTRARFRKELEESNVEVERVEDIHAWIDTYHDYEEMEDNSLVKSGDGFYIEGHRIKIAGDHPSCGLRLVDADDPNNKVKFFVYDNFPSRLTGTTPAMPPGHKHYYVEITTQFSGSGSTMLTTPRVIRSAFTLESF